MRDGFYIDHVEQLSVLFFEVVVRLQVSFSSIATPPLSSPLFPRHMAQDDVVSSQIAKSPLSRDTRRTPVAWRQKSRQPWHELRPPRRSLASSCQSAVRRFGVSHAAYCRMVQRRPRYMVACAPRV